MGQGWAAVSLDEESVAAVAAAYNSLGHLSVKPDALRGLKKKFDGNRFVGSGGDAGRDWMQIRRGFEDRTKFPWENEPEGCREVFFKVFTVAEALARDCLTAILRQIDHPAKGEQLD